MVGYVPNTCTWMGYEFTVYGYSSTTWSDVPGVYLFTQYLPQTATMRATWYVWYVGETSSFASRLPGHERWPDAAAEGATHVHAAAVEPEETRVGLEKRLRELLDPPLNVL